MVGVCADAVHAGRLGAVADCRLGQEPAHPRPKSRCLLPKPPRALHTGALIYSASLEWNIYLFSSLKFSFILPKKWRLDQAAGLPLGRANSSTCSKEQRGGHSMNAIFKCAGTVINCLSAPQTPAAVHELVASYHAWSQHTCWDTDRLCLHPN
jgi:hypothetical protein